MSLTIGMIGRVAEGSDLCDGQTVKTRVLKDELVRKYPDARLLIADTYQYKKHFLRLFCKIEQCIRKSDVIFILLSWNGRRVIFPLVNTLNLIHHKPILHDVIGGAFESELLEKRSLARNCRRFAVNWIESRRGVERLKAAGFQNVEYLPNFKRLSPVSLSERDVFPGSVYRFCTFSRVRAEKGIGLAAQAILDINREAGSCKATLDIFGPIEDGFEEELQQYLDSPDGAVRYKGVVDFNDSVSILKHYDMLLFPTTYRGEGFPGTLIDAFSAGLPVIATDWHYNGEIISEGRTGFLYAPEETHRLKELIGYSMDNPALIGEMRRHCLEEVKQYDADAVMEIIAQKIEAVVRTTEK